MESQNMGEHLGNLTFIRSLLRKVQFVSLQCFSEIYASGMSVVVVPRLALS